MTWAIGRVSGFSDTGREGKGERIEGVIVRIKRLACFVVLELDCSDEALLPFIDVIHFGLWGFRKKGQKSELRTSITV